MTMNEDGTISVADGLVICLHTGTLTRSRPVTDDGLEIHHAVCSRCGAWTASIFWPTTPGPVLFAPEGDLRCAVLKSNAS
jgi:hypothetical protein